MVKVLVYMNSLNQHTFNVKSMLHGREYATRITREGLWIIDQGKEVFYGPHQIYKVKVWDDNAD